MLEAKDYRYLDLLFPFVFAYAETWTGFSEEAHMKKIHVQYTDIISSLLMSDNYSNGWSVNNLANMRETV